MTRKLLLLTLSLCFWNANVCSAALPVPDLKTLINVEGGFVSFASKDGFKIYARLFAPKELNKTKYPALIYLHGGPHSNFANEAPSIFPPFLDAGFVILAINYRGSRGYDSEYFSKIIGDIGGKDIDDVLAGLDFLKKQPFVDAKKIVLAGHSYGAYLAHMTVCKKPGLFSAAVIMSGPADLREQFALLEKNVKAGLVPSSVLEEMKSDAGKRYADAGFLESRSPSAYVKSVKLPIFIIHGKNDKFCPVEPIEKYSALLKAANPAAKIWFMKGYGHDLGIFKESEHQKQVFSAIIRWLNKEVFKKI